MTAFSISAYSMPLQSINNKRSDIRIIRWHGNRAEYTVPFAPGDNTDIISGILFQFGSAAFID